MNWFNELGRARRRRAVEKLLRRMHMNRHKAMRIARHVP